MSYRAAIPLLTRHEAGKQVTLRIPFVDDNGDDLVTAGKTPTARIQKPDLTGADPTSVAWEDAPNAHVMAIVLNAAFMAAEGNYIAAAYIDGEAAERFAFHAEAAI